MKKKQTVIERRTSLLAAHASAKTALEHVMDALVECVGPETDQLVIAVKALRSIANMLDAAPGFQNGYRARGLARGALEKMGIHR